MVKAEHILSVLRAGGFHVVNQSAIAAVEGATAPGDDPLTGMIFEVVSPYGRVLGSVTGLAGIQALLAEHTDKQAGVDYFLDLRSGPGFVNYPFENAVYRVAPGEEIVAAQPAPGGMVVMRMVFSSETVFEIDLRLFVQADDGVIWTPTAAGVALSDTTISKGMSRAERLLRDRFK